MDLEKKRNSKHISYLTAEQLDEVAWQILAPVQGVSIGRKPQLNNKTLPKIQEGITTLLDEYLYNAEAFSKTLFAQAVMDQLGGYTRTEILRDIIGVAEELSGLKITVNFGETDPGFIAKANNERAFPQSYVSPLTAPESDKNTGLLTAYSI